MYALFYIEARNTINSDTKRAAFTVADGPHDRAAVAQDLFLDNLPPGYRTTRLHFLCLTEEATWRDL